jgi:transposase
MSGRTSRHHVGTRCSAGDWPSRGKEPARSYDHLQQKNEKLRKQVAEQERKIAEQQEQIADLQWQLTAFQKNSSNSSKPPSSVGPFKATQTRRLRSKRNPGGQLGHPGHWHPQVPPDQVQQVVSVLPLCCKRCGQSLPQRFDEIQAGGQMAFLKPSRKNLRPFTFRRRSSNRVADVRRSSMRAVCCTHKP